MLLTCVMLVVWYIRSCIACILNDSSTLEYGQIITCATMHKITNASSHIANMCVQILSVKKNTILLWLWNKHLFCVIMLKTTTFIIIIRSILSLNVFMCDFVFLLRAFYQSFYFGPLKLCQQLGQRVVGVQVNNLSMLWHILRKGNFNRGLISDGIWLHCFRSSFVLVCQSIS